MAYPAPGVGKNIVLVDFGLKHSILREFSKRDCNVTVVPYNITAEEILHLNPDGVMLSNGPGNPENVPEALDMIRGVQGKIPIFVDLTTLFVKLQRDVLILQVRTMVMPLTVTLFLIV